MQEYNENTEMQLEDFSEKECRQLQKILKRFLKLYKEKSECMSDEEWLYQKLKKELPEVNEEALRDYSYQTLREIKDYNKNRKNLEEACENGTTKEQWFADKIADAAKGMSVNEYGNYLKGIDNTLTNANAQVYRTVTTKGGEINQCMNLDGFLAEQHHVNTFNENAALEKSPYRAEVCVPEAGEIYGKNSFDVIIRDTRTGKRVNQYQLKYGQSAKETIELLKKGNYNNQRIVVPAEQVEEVKKAFPNKSVEGFIGGTETVGVKSNPLTKEEAKGLQIKIQKNKEVPNTDWNSYNTKNLALHIGRQAGFAGVQAAAITTGFVLAQKVIEGETMDADETVEIALQTGVDTGVKAATAGTLKVAVEKGIIKSIPKTTPAGSIVNIACVAIENVKVLMKVAKGDLTVAEATEEMGRNTTVMTAGFIGAAKGTAVGVAALSWVPIIGPVIGGAVGSMVGYAAGSKVGNGIFEGAKKVVQGAKTLANNMYEGIKEAGSKVLETVRSWLPW